MLAKDFRRKPHYFAPRKSAVCLRFERKLVKAYILSHARRVNIVIYLFDGGVNGIDWYISQGIRKF